MDIEKKILSLLQSVPLDKYSIHRMIPTESIFMISKAIDRLQDQGQIHIVKHRKDIENRNFCPFVLCIRPRSEKDSELDTRNVFEGMTSERYAEYKFVLRNLYPETLRQKYWMLVAQLRSSLIRSQNSVETDVKSLVLILPMKLVITVSH